MKDYGRKSVFSGFLPGIAGKCGIPMWCFYVNRGQGVVSFGIEDKEHAIMEFYPAHVAYQNVKRTGFRTFIKKDGQFYEPFSGEELAQEMEIGRNHMRITEEDPESGLRTQVTYYVLPEEPVAALVREVMITNQTKETCRMEVIDGMPAVIPYGVSMESMKNMTQTAKAWMQAVTLGERTELYRVRASMEDSADVREVSGANFALAVDEEGQALSGIVDPEVIFSYDTSLGNPEGFREQSPEQLLARRQNRTNIVPCAFFTTAGNVQPGESIRLYELYGQTETTEKLQDFLQKDLNGAFFREKALRAEQLTQELTDVIHTRTGNETFDAYCRYTYMDNVLRGGEPIQLTDHRLFYLYSRKHGDLERDYNDFAMAPEYFSQGNGNFRDVAQNRRCDMFFHPEVGRHNIHIFYSLIQPDGYNPLKLEKMTYRYEGSREAVVCKLPETAKTEELQALLQHSYTPGQLYGTLERIPEIANVKSLFTLILENSAEETNAQFGEGYWSDHWDYNLDLIEEYLAVFPEQERELYFEEAYRFYQSPKGVLPRSKRYVKTQKGIRQYRFLQEIPGSNKDGKGNFLTDLLRGGELTTTLLEKLLLLCAVKFSTLDAYGMGVEMEGGKPGWYDALNGLPGLFGSSMAETYELQRMLEKTMEVLGKYPGQYEMLIELAELFRNLKKNCREYEQNEDLMEFWNLRNDSRENYREKVYEGISGERIRMDSGELLEILQTFRDLVTEGMERAGKYGSACVPTYFYYEVTDYEEWDGEIVPKSFWVHPVADFLEGPVRYLKLPGSCEAKRELYRKVKNSDLYDKTLGMYKVNASLRRESYELGRATAFTPGWLENESIWLHMEYKYLLELLKSGMYEEFAEDFHKAGIPFQPEERYGRSCLENSSFLASSSNPNPDIRGKGYVARLSGSTVEFLQMWRIMMFGICPFYTENGKLCLQFAPAIPEYLLDQDLSIRARFLGKTDVVYHVPCNRAYYPGDYHIYKIQLTDREGNTCLMKGDRLEDADARKVREGNITGIEVWMEASKS